MDLDAAADDQSLVTSPKIFINYRVGDAEFAAAMVRDQLGRRFGRDVFWAERAISPGDTWVSALTEAVRKCRVMIALIGPAWLAARDEHGTRWIDRKTDPVRREIETAAQAGVWIIPVLLPGAPKLRRDDLPDSLATLADRQFLHIGPSSTGSTFAPLIDLTARLLAEAGDQAGVEANVGTDIPTRGALVAAVTEAPSRTGRSPGMTASSRRIRREPVPDGPIRDFFDRLHELHRWAGEPSTRSIASSLGKGVISYGTVYSTFRGPQVPRWPHVELIVEALDGDIDVFRRAWVDARGAEDALRADRDADST